MVRRDAGSIGIDSITGTFSALRSHSVRFGWHAVTCFTVDVFLWSHINLPQPLTVIITCSFLSKSIYCSHQSNALSQNGSFFGSLFHPHMHEDSSAATQVVWCTEEAGVKVSSPVLPGSACCLLLPLFKPWFLSLFSPRGTSSFAYLPARQHQGDEPSCLVLFVTVICQLGQHL